MMDNNTETIDHRKVLTVMQEARKNHPRIEFSLQAVDKILDALEAAEAELTRRDTVIATVSELRRELTLIEADRVLSSDWLSRRDAEVAAKALEDAGAKLRVAAAREADQGNSARYAQGIKDSGDAIIRTANSLRASSLGAENPDDTTYE